jgi:hypothetical protein
VTTRLLALVWPDLRLTEADAAPFEPMLDALDDLLGCIHAVGSGRTMAQQRRGFEGG